MKVFLQLSISAAILALAMTSSPTAAGDLERICNIGCITQYCGPGVANACLFKPEAEAIEAWADPNGPSDTGIPWRLRVSGTNNDIVPGFYACGSPTTAEGYLAVVFAAREWNDIPVEYQACPKPDVYPVGVFTSEFRLQDNPTIDTSLGLAADGINLVTFWHPSFTGLGGAGALGAAVVRLASVQGAIWEADIALNATTDGSGNPYWGWVSETSGSPRIAYDPPGGFDTPLCGYADIQGVLVHEFGHMAGLGHAVIDSTANASSSRFPSMFPVAQVETFAGTMQYYSDSSNCAVLSSVVIDGSTTEVGGILGRSARDIEIDDIAAIGRGYPTTDHDNGTGGISGRVFNASMNPVAGVSVVAIGENCENRVRASTLTYFQTTPALNGTYTLSGLPPGNYYLYAERVDTPSGTNDPYFPAPLDPPDYVAPGGFTPFTCADCPGPAACIPPVFVYSCVRNPAPFVPEFFNTNDAASERSQLATRLTVTAGNTLTGRDFVLGSTTRLEVRELPNTAASTRGVQVPAVDGSANPTQVEFAVITGDPSLAGTQVELHLSYSHSNSILQNQLRQVPSGPPLNTIGTLDATGTFRYVYTLNPAAQTFRNIFAQALIRHPGTFPDPAVAVRDRIPYFDYEITNMVNVWVQTPSPVGPVH